MTASLVSGVVTAQEPSAFSVMTAPMDAINFTADGEQGREAAMASAAAAEAKPWATKVDVWRRHKHVGQQPRGSSQGQIPSVRFTPTLPTRPPTRAPSLRLDNTWSCGHLVTTTHARAQPHT